MSITVYLKEGVESISGYKERVMKDRGQEWTVYSLPELTLFRDKGRWHVYLHELTEPVPEIIKDYLDEISFYEWFPLRPKRICGIYRVGDTEGDLDEQGDHYVLRIRGQSMVSIREMYLKLRSGKLTPNINFEVAQERAQEG